MLRPKQILAIQLAILAVCILALGEFVSSFPYPSPLIQPLLPPKLRWPEAQVDAWVDSGAVDKNFLTFFARDPERTIPPGENWVSPADGLVQAIPTRDGTTYFVVALSFWDVHVVRAPVAGIVKSVEQEGFRLTRKLTEEEKNENIFLRGKAAPVQQIVTLGTEHGDVKVRLITSYWASRLKVWVREGQQVAKGERVGRILLGSTVVAEVPSGIAFSVMPGERVVAGETIIAGGGRQ